MVHASHFPGQCLNLFLYLLYFIYSSQPKEKQFIESSYLFHLVWKILKDKHVFLNVAQAINQNIKL